MRWSVALGAVSLALALACAGGKTGGGVGNTTPTAMVGGTDTQIGSTVSVGGQVSDALLAVSDLPAGWSETPGESTSPGSSALCNVNLDETKVANATGNVSRSFTKGGAVGPFFVEVIVTLPGSGASDDLNAVRDALKSCQQWTEPGTSNGGPTTYNVAELSVPKLGDDSIAVRLTSDATILGAVVADVAFVRRGHSLLVDAYTTVSAIGGDVDYFVSLTRSADDKAGSHDVN